MAVPGVRSGMAYRPVDGRHRGSNACTHEYTSRMLPVAIAWDTVSVCVAGAACGGFPSAALRLAGAGRIRIGGGLEHLYRIHPALPRRDAGFRGDGDGPPHIVAVPGLDVIVRLDCRGTPDHVDARNCVQPALWPEHNSVFARSSRHRG